MMRYKRITMPREVNKILRQIGREKGQLFCKGSKDTFFGVKTLEYREGAGVIGRIVIFNARPRKFEKVLVNFSIGRNRFFAMAKFGSNENLGLLKFEPVFYRLERRAHLRVPLNDYVKKTANIIRWSDKTVFIPADIQDFSMGGAQLAVLARRYRPARSGTKIRVVMHVKSKWRIDIEAEIRRIEIGDDLVTIGLKFRNRDYSTQRQIQALASELQHEYIRDDAYIED